MHNSDMEWSLILLELALPYFYKGVLSQYNGSGAVRDALIQTQATYKKPLSDDVVQYANFSLKNHFHMQKSLT